MDISLPSSWQLLKIADVAQVNPRRPSELLNLPNDYKVTFVPMPSVCEHQGAITEPIEKSYAEVRRGFTYFAEDDVIFAKITPCMQNGKSAIARRLTNGLGFGSTEFHVLRAGEKVIPEWLYYFVRQQSFRKEAQANFRGSAGQQRVPADFLAEHFIPVPHPEEQCRIVERIKECLSRVDEIKSLREESQQEARALVKSRRHELWLELSRNKRSITSFGSIVQSFKNGLYKPAKFYGHGTLFVRMFNIKDGSFITSRFERVEVDEIEQEKYALSAGDLLISRVNSRELVGKSAIVPELPETSVFEAMLIRVRIDKSKAVSDFVVEMMNSPECLAGLRAKAKHAIGQSSLNQQDIASTEIPLPDIHTQERLAEEFAVLRHLSRNLEGEMLEGAQENNLLTQSILRKAFAGEL